MTLIPRSSRCETLLFNISQIIPLIANGLFRRRHSTSRIINALHPDPSGQSLGRKLRGHTQTPAIRTRILTSPAVLLFDPELIRHVLANSPMVYGPPKSKIRGMSYYQPDSLTISTGQDWGLRREFHEKVLSPSETHPLAARFVKVAKEEAQSLYGSNSHVIAWNDLSSAFAAIALRVIFGDCTRTRSDVIGDLNRLRSRANWLVGLSPGQRFRRFRNSVEELLRSPETETLSALCMQLGREVKGLQIVSQITHWMFAMHETLAENTAAALALILNHPEVVPEIRAELSVPRESSVPPSSPLLEGCFREAMRLWPTTPFLIREARITDLLGSEIIVPGTQVIVWNSFNHRDPLVTPDAGRFRPERWQDSETHQLPFYPLSAGARKLRWESSCDSPRDNFSW